MLNNPENLGCAFFSHLLSLPADFSKTMHQVTSSYKNKLSFSQYIGIDVVMLKCYISYRVRHNIFKSSSESEQKYLITSFTFLSFLLNPLDHILVKLQTRQLNQNLKISNSFNTLRYIIRIQGMRGLYRGSLANTLKTFSYLNTGYFSNMTIYPYHVISWKYAISALSLIPVIVISHPFDVIKSHMQFCLNQKLTFLNTTIDIYQRLGIRGFYRGFLYAYIRNCFVVINTLTSFEVNYLSD
jgi:hypothetical protein